VVWCGVVRLVSRDSQRAIVEAAVPFVLSIYYFTKIKQIMGELLLRQSENPIHANGWRRPLPPVRLRGGVTTVASSWVASAA
jgi:hypothetical protein